MGMTVHSQNIVVRYYLKARCLWLLGGKKNSIKEFGYGKCVENTSIATIKLAMVENEITALLKKVWSEVQQQEHTG